MAYQARLNTIQVGISLAAMRLYCLAFQVQVYILEGEQKLTSAYCVGEAMDPAVCDRCSAMAASGLCGILQSGFCSSMEVYSDTMA